VSELRRPVREDNRDVQSSLHGRRHRGRRPTTPDPHEQQLLRARQLRAELVEDHDGIGSVSADYVQALDRYVRRYREHWATVLGESPFDFGPLPGGVGPGWQQLLNELDADLQAIDPGYFVEHVKQKLGLLRAYVMSFRSPALSDALSDAVGEYAGRSASICEDCGGPARRRHIDGWRRTVCDEHASGAIAGP
jgi:hypothetical protein